MQRASTISRPGCDRIAIGAADPVQSPVGRSLFAALSPADLQWIERATSGIRLRTEGDLSLDGPFGAKPSPLLS